MRSQIKRRWLEPHYAWIVAGILALILYGSFFPFDFYEHRDPRGPLGILLESSWRTPRADFVENIVFYLPLGFFAVYALKIPPLAAAIAGTAAGFVLSLFVETAQFYDHGRFQELSDLLANTIGAGLGAAAAAVSRGRLRSPFVGMVIACWLGSRWYPFYPLVWGSRFRPVSLAPAFPLLDVFEFSVAWLAVGLMLETLCGAPRSRAALIIAVCASVAMRALVADAKTQPAEIAGGAIAVLLWCLLLWRQRARAVIIAGLFAVLVALLALSPFHFTNTGRHFGWTPFLSFYTSPVDAAVRNIFEKTFLYGSLVWLLQRAGSSVGFAAVAGASLVFCLRLAQVYLPGRSAEITDAIMVLMLAGMLRVMSASPFANASQTNPKTQA